MSVLVDIQKVHIIREWVEDNSDTSFDRRDELEIKIIFRNIIFDRWLRKYLEYKHTSEALHGWWLENRSKRLSNLIFFKDGTCSCSKKGRCIHLEMKEVCDQLAIQKTGEIGLGYRIFMFLF